MGKVVNTVVIVVALLLATSAAVFSGVFDVGADAPHWKATSALIGFIRHRSIEYHADRIRMPDDLNSPRRIAEGAALYDERCGGCHLAPDRRHSALRRRLSPRPTDLTRRGVDDPGATFWVIKHGIGMTGMPAWGKAGDDGRIWDLVALLKVLPNIDARQWRRLIEMNREANAAGDHPAAGGERGQSQ